MQNINYHNRKFSSSANSDNGEVSNQTIFIYQQDGEMIWADYKGGNILKGHLIGKADTNGNLEFVYHHLNHDMDIKTGKCKSTPQILEDGRIRLQELWQWTSGDYSSGESIIEEMAEN